MELSMSEWNWIVGNSRAIPSSSALSYWSLYIQIIRCGGGCIILVRMSRLTNVVFPLNVGPAISIVVGWWKGITHAIELLNLIFQPTKNSFYFYSVPLQDRVRLRYLTSILQQTRHSFVASLNSRSAVLSWEHDGIRQDGSRCGTIKSLYRRRASSQVQSSFPLPPRLGSRIS